jgi:hypothetical protein
MRCGYKECKNKKLEEVRSYYLQFRQTIARGFCGALFLDKCLDSLRPAQSYRLHKYPFTIICQGLWELSVNGLRLMKCFFFFFFFFFFLNGNNFVLAKILR